MPPAPDASCQDQDRAVCRLSSRTSQRPTASSSMTSRGFRCVEAGNGEEALAQLQRHPITLVMSDLRMPKMDGLELLRQTRARWPDVAVVMITAVADVEVAVSCLAIGAMDYLTKPFHLEEVRARVAQAMENRRLVMENRGYQESVQAKAPQHARR